MWYRLSGFESWYSELRHCVEVLVMIERAWWVSIRETQNDSPGMWHCFHMCFEFWVFVYVYGLVLVLTFCSNFAPENDSYIGRTNFTNSTASGLILLPAEINIDFTEFSDPVFGDPVKREPEIIPVHLTRPATAWPATRFCCFAWNELPFEEHFSFYRMTSMTIGTRITRGNR